jgi:hypothetical protein
MKTEYRLLVTSFLAAGLLASACVSGETVMGSGGTTGGKAGTTGSTGGTTGGGTGGKGGTTGGGTGGKLGGSGGVTGGGLGGFTGGGTGGTVVVGGTGGTGPAGCPRSVPLIDNFDDVMRGGPATGGYFNFNCGVGSWYVYGDSTATATVTPPFSSISPFTSSTPGHGGTGYAAHVTASGFMVYGVGLGVNINSSGTTISTVNASAYSGITFWMMGTAAGTEGTNMLRVSIPTPSSSSPASGGTCAIAGTTTYCDGHYGKIIPVPATWTQVTVRWTELTKDAMAGGDPVFSPAAIIGVHWQAGASATVTAGMNIWIDDLAFAP